MTREREIIINSLHTIRYKLTGNLIKVFFYQDKKIVNTQAVEFGSKLSAKIYFDRVIK